MLAIRLHPKTEARLARLAEKTDRTKTFHARKAIEEYIEDTEDNSLAVEAIREPGRVYSAQEAKRELGLSD